MQSGGEAMLEAEFGSTVGLPWCLQGYYVANIISCDSLVSQCCSSVIFVRRSRYPSEAVARVYQSTASLGLKAIVSRVG